jgi:hypothetical protein
VAYFGTLLLALAAKNWWLLPTVAAPVGTCNSHVWNFPLLGSSAVLECFEKQLPLCCNKLAAVADLLLY